MKNEKNIRIAATAVPSIADKVSDVRVDVCLNLRPSPDGRALVPVGEPMAVGPASWEPLFSFTHASRKLRLWAAGNILGISTGQLDGSQINISEIGTLRSVPRDAELWCDMVRILTATGYEYVDLSSAEPVFLGPMPELPQVRLRAVSIGRMSAPVEDASVDSPLERRQSAEFASSELRDITADMLDAYNRLYDNAATASRCIQPVIARYRVVAPDGSTLFRSVPVMVAAPTGFQCLGPSYATVDSGSTWRRGGSVAADSFIIAADTPASLPAPWQRIAARIDIELTPQLHPINFNGQSHATFTLNENNRADIRMTLPGAPDDFSGRSSAMHPILGGILRRLPSVMSVAASVANPFGGGLASSGASFYALPVHAAGAKREWHAIHRALAKPAPEPTAASHILARCSAPHAAVPSLVSKIGPVTFMPDPVATLFRGMKPSMFVATFADESWRAAAVTRVAGVGQVVSMASGSSGAPSTFSPLLCYPLAEAESITLSVERGGSTHLRKLCPLTPVAADGFAYFLHPSLCSFSLDTVAEPYSPPASTDAPIPHPGVVLTAAVSGEAQPADAAILQPQPVVDVRGAMRSSSSLDFARTKALVFGHAGIFAIVTDSHGSVRTADIIDSRPVGARSAICATTSASAPILALAGTDLVKVSPTRAVTLVADIANSPQLAPSPQIALAFSPRFSELWMLPASGRPLILHLPSMALFTRSLSVRALHPDADRLLIATPVGLCDADVEVPEATSVEWIAHYAPDRPAGGVRAYELSLTSSPVELNLSIFPDHSLPPAPFAPVGTSATLTLSQSLQAPLRLPFRPLLPFFHVLSFRLAATLAPAARFSAITLFNEE